MRTLRLFAILAVLGALMVPAAARAQTQIRADVPFEFVVGGVTLPAGHYEFTQQGLPVLLSICNLEDATRKVVIANPVYRLNPQRSEAVLIFHKYGDRYFLSEVWGEASTGRRVPQTRQEREVSQRAQAQTVLVAAR